MKFKLGLFAVFLLALFLRSVDINNNPPALYGDELTLVYDAYSILKTGHDQTGKFLPLTFSMSEGRPPFYVYLTVPLVALFGLEPIAVRLLSILSGVGIVIFSYFLTKTLTNKMTAFWVALISAILPWDFAISRGGFETHLALFLTLMSAYLFIKAKDKPYLFLLSALGFGLSIHTYHSYKIIVPIFLLVLIWFTGYFKLWLLKPYKKIVLLSLFVFVFFISVWLGQVFLGYETRFQNTNIFTNKEIEANLIQKINEERNISNLSPLIKPIFHNKFIEYTGIIISNYLSHFSPKFLFLSGDGNPRHNPTLMGELYTSQIVLILIGVLYLFRTNLQFFILLVAWLLIAPIPTTITSEAHALRSSFMIPPLVILSGIGFNYLLELSKRKTVLKFFTIIIIIALLGQFVILINRFYFLSGYQFSHFWSYSAKIATNYALENKQNFDLVIISTKIDSLETAFPVYAKVEPNEVISQRENSVTLNNYQFKKWNEVYISQLSSEQIMDFLTKSQDKILYIGDIKEKDSLRGYNIYSEGGKSMFLTLTK